MLNISQKCYNENGKGLTDFEKLYEKVELTIEIVNEDSRKDQLGA